MSTISGVKTVLTQFKSESGELIGSPFDIPIDINSDKLQLICNALLQNEVQIPYIFFANDIEISETLRKTLESNPKLFESEKCLEIVFAPQAVFHVEAVSRCSGSIAGHSDSVVSVAFSPDGTRLASGSGDTTVRFWDINTETPQFTCRAHKHWVLAIAWAPNGRRLASADKNGTIFIWDPKTGEQLGNALLGHKQWVNCIVWEPLHWFVYHFYVNPFLIDFNLFSNKKSTVI
jgi:ribosome assembly protein 4